MREAAALAGADGFVARCPQATRRSSATAAARSRRASGGASRSPARSCATRRSWCSTSRPPISTAAAPTLVAEAVARLASGRTVLADRAPARARRGAPTASCASTAAGLVEPATRRERRVTLRRLLALAGAPRPRVALAVGARRARPCSAASALMATAGYLISRAAEQPPILSLDGRDRRRALLRAGPAARALPRAARLARPRAARARPRARARLRADRAARARASSRRYRRGDLLAPDGRRRRRAAGAVPARARAAARRARRGRRRGRRRPRRSCPRRRWCWRSGSCSAASPCRRSPALRRGVRARARRPRAAS